MYYLLISSFLHTSFLFFCPLLSSILLSCHLLSTLFLSSLRWLFPLLFPPLLLSFYLFSPLFYFPLLSSLLLHNRLLTPQLSCLSFISSLCSRGVFCTLYLQVSPSLLLSFVRQIILPFVRRQTAILSHPDLSS